MCSCQGKHASANSHSEACTSECRAETTVVDASGLTISGGHFLSTTGEAVDNASIAEFLSEVESLMTDTEYFTANSSNEGNARATSFVPTAG